MERREKPQRKYWNIRSTHNHGLAKWPNLNITTCKRPSPHPSFVSYTHTHRVSWGHKPRTDTYLRYSRTLKYYSPCYSLSTAVRADGRPMCLGIYSCIYVGLDARGDARHARIAKVLIFNIRHGTTSTGGLLAQKFLKCWTVLLFETLWYLKKIKENTKKKKPEKEKKITIFYGASKHLGNIVNKHM